MNVPPFKFQNFNFKMSFWAGPKIIVSNRLNGFLFIALWVIKWHCLVVLAAWVGNTNTRARKLHADSQNCVCISKEAKNWDPLLLLTIHTYTTHYYFRMRWVEQSGVQSRACSERTTEREKTTYFFFSPVVISFTCSHITHENKINVCVCVCGFGGMKGVDVQCTCFMLTFFSIMLPRIYRQKHTATHAMHCICKLP